ncbi:Phage-associated protein, family (modular protein) [Xenorhabdus bovienii str. puntauvense]|uniref:Phage-associated protein, family (Modular protein) n=1 Tax=Xenorhabdus bovienii str. puntauvense TaxID=1398201 RepID=A0A077NBU5_XENBV|nr:DUF1073 domain-containing protein [Xenorhabdus bovienii]CDG95703.1 Phage-associated protein, family (modular protein) [Xenorhabdus bovienii str. puntauvense]
MAKNNRKPQPTADSYENMMARVGMQTPNQHSASTYKPNWTSRNRMLIENAYRSSWIIGAAVDSVSDDMTRKGIRITSEIDPKARGVLESMFDELELWENLNNIIKWSRLYGGALGLILIEGQAPFTPLRPETIGQGKFKGLLPLDRWQVNPDLNRRIKVIGKDLGKPEFYNITNTGRGIPAWKIHHSRLIRFDGVTLPYQQAQTENEWGMSIVERIFDRLTAFDSATTGAAQLVYKAHLRTYSIDKLREIIALGGAKLDALLKHMDMIRQFQSNEGMTLMDKNDVFETHTYTFSGLDKVLAQFAEQISGAVGIPLVRLFGQSPQGFSTGDADLANYYDNIGTQQERRLRQPLRRLLDVMHRSEFGQELPEDFTFEFNPLWQMSDLDRSTIAMNTVNALNGALDGGMMNLKAAMNDLREMADVTGIGSSISDEDINNAENEAPPLSELGPSQSNTGEFTESNTNLNGAQISSMVEIVSSVAAGELPRDTGIQMLVTSYHMDSTEAERIMGSVGDGFTAKSTEGSGDDPQTVPAGGKPIPNQSTKDSAGGRKHRQGILRWFK